MSHMLNYYSNEKEPEFNEADYSQEENAMEEVMVEFAEFDVNDEESEVSNDSNDEDCFVIERIITHVNTKNSLDHRIMFKNESQLACFDFYVKWEGFPDSENLWLPYKEVKDTKAYIQYELSLI